jgi:hypothetical protein
MRWLIDGIWPRNGFGPVADPCSQGAGSTAWGMEGCGAIRHSQDVQSQELTRSSHAVTPCLDASRIAATPPRRQRRDALLAVMSATAALVWVAILVLAVAVGLLCAMVDNVLRLRRPSPGV